MNDLVFQIALYAASFIGVWWGAGLVVGSVSRVAYAIKLPEFTISFFILGLLTSLPEISVSLTALGNGNPGISVGNLIGAVLVLFLLVIPLLGLSTKGITVPKPAQRVTLLVILLVCFLPTFLLRDRKLEIWEGVACVLAYVTLFFFFSKQQNIFEKIKGNIKSKRGLNLWDGVKIIAGMGLLFLGSSQIVESTLFFANVLTMAPFFVSLVIVSLGTNIPEITLVFRSILLNKPDVALADYMGSASANTLVLGVLSLIHQKTITIPSHFLHRFLFMLIGLCIVYLFMRSNDRISKWECFILLLLYILFISVELLLI